MGMMFAIRIRFTWPSHRILKMQHIAPNGDITENGNVHRLEELQQGQIQRFNELHRWYTPGFENTALLELQSRVLHPKRSSSIGGVILWSFFFVILQWTLCYVLLQLRYIIQVIPMLDCAGTSLSWLPYWPIYCLAFSTLLYGISAVRNKDIKGVLYLTQLPTRFAVDECTCCSLGDQLLEWGLLERGSRERDRESFRQITFRRFRHFAALLKL